MVEYVISIYCLISVVTRPLSGYMLDNICRKKIVICALIMYILCLKFYVLVSGFMVLLIVRGIQGFFWGFTSTGLGIMSVIALLFINYEENISHKAKKKGKININDFFEKEVFWLARIMFFIAIIFGAIISFIIIYV